MRKTVLTTLGALLIAGSAVQIATASEHHIRKVHRVPAQDSRAFRDVYDGPYAIPQSQGERNIENFGFSGRDPSRVGGWDPNLNPSGS
jgi:hypothetical protein